MRFVIVVLWALLSLAPAMAQVSVGISTPHVSIGINVPVYPQLARVPGYPVYYAPQLRANFFFYDGMYWVFEGDNWYASYWYNGPWSLVAPQVVPVYVLRIPVRYYRSPPVYFRGWRPEAPPRWGEHWGNEWEREHHGWDQWDRRSAPKPAPLPAYQRQYSGNRYPAPAQQPELHARNYRYEPREPVVKQHYPSQGSHAPAAAPRRAEQQRAPGPRGEDNRPSHGSGRDQGPGKGRDKGEDRPQDRDK